jgi:hypothetical protein
MAQVKGISVAKVFRFAEERFGREGLDQLEEALGPERFGRLHPPLPSSWYEFHDVVALWETTDKQLGSGDLSLLQALIEQGVEWDLSTVYRIFFKVGNPVYLLRKGTSMWRNYYSHGRWDIVETPNGVRGTLLEFPEPHPVHCFTVRTWLRKFLSMTRVPDPRVEMISCRAQGDAACIYDASWK